MNKTNIKSLAADHHEDKTVLGFWVYLMTDLIMFAALFAAFAALRGNTFGGPSGEELFNLPFALTETVILLTSSFTCGLATLAFQQNKKNQVLGWYAVTMVLGLSFLAMEMTEFHRLLAEGNSFTRSAFLSSFFALVGTHGLHIAIGVLWMAIAMVIVVKRGLNPVMNSKLTRLSLFWHFLDLVWIFIFTIVYLMGAL